MRKTKLSPQAQKALEEVWARIAEIQKGIPPRQLKALRLVELAEQATWISQTA